MYFRSPCKVVRREWGSQIVCSLPLEPLHVSGWTVASLVFDLRSKCWNRRPLWFARGDGGVPRFNRLNHKVPSGVSRIAPDGPKWPPRRPQGAPKTAKMAARGMKNGPRSPQDGPRPPQDGPRSPQDAQRGLQEDLQEGPKMAQRRVQETPRATDPQRP